MLSPQSPHWSVSVAITLYPCARAVASVRSKAVQSRAPLVVASCWKNQARIAFLPGPIAVNESSRIDPSIWYQHQPLEFAL